jgi:type VI secretion system protein ImpJ
VALAAEQSYPGAIETLKLGEFERDPEGIWRLNEGHVPPLLQVGTSPFLRSVLDDLPQTLEAFQYKLAMDSASYLSGGSLYTVKQCLKSVYRMQRLLANLQRQVHIHPYVLYNELKDFYIDVCFYRDSSPKNVADPYNHDQLAECFKRIMEPLADQMQLAEKRSPYRPFEFRDGVYGIELPQEVRQAKEIYFLIQKSQVNKAVALNNFKIAAPSRLATVHKLALKGVPVTKIDRPMLAHSFGPEVEFYQLMAGEEWEYALKEGGVAFYNSPSFQEMEFYLYWHFG